MSADPEAELRADLARLAEKVPVRQAASWSYGKTVDFKDCAARAARDARATGPRLAGLLSELKRYHEA